MKGYNIPPAAIALGAPQTTPVNGRVGVESRPDLIRSAHENLFTSGTLGRYSKILNSVLEKRANQSIANRPRGVRRPVMVFLVITLIKLALIAFVLLTTLAYLQWVERKVIAHVQVRMGPIAWVRTACCNRWRT